MVYEELVPVQNTSFSDYFEDAEMGSVLVLNQEKANDVWSEKIDSNSTSYFNLPDDCWIITSKSKSIGEWIDAYNNNDNAAVSDIIKQSVSWDKDAVVRFFAKKDIVFQSKWSVFLKLWDNFLAVEDDCPIIVPEKMDKKEALLFRPIGDILKIG